ncbi:WD40-repeat-containing domain protein, partial [Blyttiomyces helicus]
TVFHLGQDDLFCMEMSPFDPKVFATGGNERDLSVWDLRKSEPPSDADADAPSPETPLHRTLQPTWKAKNVKHDNLDMRVPVWITALKWLSPTRIVTASGYGQVRVYDTTKARRPVVDVKIGDHPIRALAVSADGALAVVSDTTGIVSHVDLALGKVVGSFRGIAGAVTSLYCCATEDKVVMVGLDRMLRIHEAAGKRRNLEKVYIKQRTQALLVDESHEDAPPPPPAPVDGEE